MIWKKNIIYFVPFTLYYKFDYEFRYFTVYYNFIFQNFSIYSQRDTKMLQKNIITLKKILQIFLYYISATKQFYWFIFEYSNSTTSMLKDDTTIAFICKIFYLLWKLLHCYFVQFSPSIFFGWYFIQYWKEYRKQNPIKL